MSQETRMRGRGQERRGWHAERRAENDCEINQEAAILSHVWHRWSVSATGQTVDCNAGAALVPMASKGRPAMLTLDTTAVGAGGVIFAVFVLLALAMVLIRVGARIEKRASTPRPAGAYARRDQRNRRTMPPRRYW